MLKTLRSHIGRYRPASLRAALCTALEVVTDVLIPYVAAMLIDRGFSPSDPAAILRYGILMALLALLSLFFGIRAARLAAYAAAGFASNLRRAMFRRIQHLPFTAVDRYSTGGLITRMTTDVNNMQISFQQILRVTIRAPFCLLLSVAMALLIDVRLSLIFLAALAVLSAALFVILRRVARRFERVFRQYDTLNTHLRETLTAQRVVKAFVRENHEAQRFGRAADRLCRLFVRAENVMAWTHPLMNLAVYACMLLLSWLGARFIVGGTLTTGALTSLFTYTLGILMSLMMLSVIFVMLSMSAVSARRVTEVLKEEGAEGSEPSGASENLKPSEFSKYSESSGASENLKPSECSTPSAPSEHSNRLRVSASSSPSALPFPLTFRSVSFTYPSSAASALRDLTFTLPAAASLGILGGTGSGKTTLVNLIPRLLSPTTGTIFFGNTPLENLPAATLRRTIALVPQQSLLFSGTLRENLRWGNANATDDELTTALSLAAALDFVRALPHGLDTRVEQGGTNFSGGQRQRLCIARALLRRPALLILDDALSACDATTEQRILHNLFSRLPHTAKVIIAQRAATVAHCQNILLLHDGTLQAQGNHAHLLANSTPYRDLVRLQHTALADFDR